MQKNIIKTKSGAEISSPSQYDLIQKSIPLLSLWSSPLGLEEFKILDAYLSRINSHHPEQRKVRFEKGELETLLNVHQIKLKSLQQRIQNLGIMVKVEDFDDKRGFRSVALFEEAECIRDDNGLWQIDLQCTPQAMKYIFNIDDIGYLRYKLRAVSSLTSRYSYLLFLYLERNRFRTSWEEDLEDFREFLGCTSDFYASYKEFNKNILKRCQKELEEKTFCRFTFEPIRIGRRVQRLKFTLNPMPEISEQGAIMRNTSEGDNNHHSAATELAEDNTELILHGREFLKTALCKPGTNTCEFSDMQLAELFTNLLSIPLSAMPSSDSIGKNPEMQRYHYLATKYAELNRRAEMYDIRNRYGYFLSMIRRDITY